MKSKIDRLGVQISPKAAMRMCFGKKLFQNRNEARDFSRRNRKKEGRTSQTPYKCLLCNNWHLTSMVAAQSAAARAKVWRN